jgi:D-sedoheptulose 7-phosphate isomerase
MKEKVISNIAAHKRVIEHFEATNTETVIEIAKLVMKTFENNHTIYLCGNGGSNADCQHLAGEFVGRYHKNRKPLPAVALSTDSALVTCIGNDYSFNDIFSRQVEALAGEGDVLWAFSTSGNSPNILAAAEVARQKGMKIIAFTGRENSRLEAMADICLCAASDRTNNSQEVHELAYHIVCDLIDDNF